MNNATDQEKQILIYDTETELYDAVARDLLAKAVDAVAQRGKFLLALAGGSTPRPLYRKLARDEAFAEFPWRQTHLFWGDERAVPPDDPQSNYGMVAEAMLDALALPEENIHRIRGEIGAVPAAREYAQKLRSMAESGLSWPRFDLVLLGLGRDGHTASLFPGSTHPSRSGQATLAVTGSYNERPTSRVTLTPPVINSARNVFFLVLGEDKALTVHKVLEGDYSPVQFPARRIRPEQGQLIWYLDRAAASKLTTIAGGQ